MRKVDYLRDQYVSEFVRWMGNHLSNLSELGRGYRRPKQDPLVFRNLSNAFDLYDWEFSYIRIDGERSAGRSFIDNERVLQDLQRRLRKAVNENDDCATRDVAIEIMRWGGVAPRNEEWLRANSQGLANLLMRVKQVFEAGDDAAGFGTSLRFNAGMTKVYSLLIDNFIIYDSRVAGALAWFILAWARDEGTENIPALLAFPCMAAKEAANAERRKLRNPRTEQFYFPMLGNRAHIHAKWNMRANWIVESLLATAPESAFSEGDEPSRRLEAALFMWGYDLAGLE